jgi:hypothetical protein
MTTEELKQLLRDPDCPWAARYFRGSPGMRAIVVPDLEKFAARRLGEAALGSGDLDEAVRAIGGKKLEMIDPWTAPQRWLKRLMGRPAPSADVYEIPERASGDVPPTG